MSENSLRTDIQCNDREQEMAWTIKGEFVAEMAPSDGTAWHDPDLPLAWEGRSGAVGQFTWDVT